MKRNQNNNSSKQEKNCGNKNCSNNKNNNQDCGNKDYKHGGNN